MHAGIQEFQDIMQDMQHQGIDLFMVSLIWLVEQNASLYMISFQYDNVFLDVQVRHLQIQAELHKEFFLAHLFPHTMVL
jgi:hypothetical protein